MSDSESIDYQPDDMDTSDVLYAHSYQTPNGKYSCELRTLDDKPVVGFAGYDSAVEAEVAAMQWYMGYMAARDW